MDFGSFVISSTSIESLIVLFQRTSNGKYNAFHQRMASHYCDARTPSWCSPGVQRKCQGDVSAERIKSATHPLSHHMDN